MGRACHCRCHHDTKGHNQLGLGESYQLGLTVGVWKLCLQRHCLLFLLLRDNFCNFFQDRNYCNLTYFALPILLTIYLGRFIAASIGTPSSAYILLRCLGTKNPIPLALGSRSVVLNPDCTLESPEGLLKILMAGPHPKRV